MDEAGAALDALSPSAVVTYAEAGGWGRALMLEARRRRIPSVGLQHGFIYRHWLNYLHEPDEMTAAGADRGCPIPDRTLVFDRYAESHLRSAGHFPDRALQVAGNGMDQLGRTVRSAAADAACCGANWAWRMNSRCRPGREVLRDSGRATGSRRGRPRPPHAADGEDPPGRDA
jgi:hypothetical protein